VALLPRYFAPLWPCSISKTRRLGEIFGYLSKVKVPGSNVLLAGGSHLAVENVTPR
jgi:hypothetical protein